MSEDVREAILARMLVVLNAIPGESDVARNLIVNDDLSRRRLVLLDGAEDIVTDDPFKPPNAPSIMNMFPLVLLGTAAKAKDVGSDASARRGKVITALVNDSALNALTLNKRGGRYIGIENTLALGFLTLDQTPLKFRYTYTLRPDQF